MNIWHDMSPRRINPDDFIAFVEIPKGCKSKYELDKDTGMLILDRVLHTSTHYPANYGFIPRTYADDLDPLDVLIVSSVEMYPMTTVRCYPIGVITMMDNGRNDEKIIAIPFDDPTYNSYKDISELPKHIFNEMSHFFSVYKTLEHKQTAVEEVKGSDAAKEIIRKAIGDYRDKFCWFGVKMLKIKETKAAKGLRIANVVLFLLIIMTNSMPFFQTMQSADSQNASSVYVFDTISADASTSEATSNDQAVYAGEYSLKENTADTRVVTVGVIEDVYNETKDKVADYKVYHWSHEEDGSVLCTPLNKTEEKSLGEKYFDGKPQKFYLFEAEIPATAEEFKFHIGNERVFDKLIYYTAIDLFLEVTTIVENPAEQGALMTMAWSSLIFFAIPIIGFFFCLLDKERNLKNVAGLLCSVAGIFSITYIAGQYLSIGSLCAIVLYLVTFFLSMLAICARYIVNTNEDDKKSGK